MVPDLKQMYNYTKMKGYQHSKDVLGTYFDKDGHKMSIVKQASWYTCFHNVQKGQGWQLISKSEIFDGFGPALHWVVKEMDKIVQ